jgi:hypothetical protein
VCWCRVRPPVGADRRHGTALTAARQRTSRMQCNRKSCHSACNWRRRSFRKCSLPSSLRICNPAPLRFPPFACWLVSEKAYEFFLSPNHAAPVQRDELQQRQSLHPSSIQRELNVRISAAALCCLTMGVELGLPLRRVSGACRDAAGLAPLPPWGRGCCGCRCAASARGQRQCSHKESAVHTLRALLARTAMHALAAFSHPPAPLSLFRPPRSLSSSSGLDDSFSSSASTARLASSFTFRRCIRFSQSASLMLLFLSHTLCRPLVAFVC